MKTAEHFQRLIRLFQSAPINKSLFEGSEIELSEGAAEYQLEIKQNYFHGAQAMHGAIYFKLLDDSAYFACATLEREHFLLTKSYQVQFIRPVQLERLTAKGKVVKEENGEIIATSEIINEKGKTVAKGEGVFVRSKRILNELEGYC